ncbi:glycerol kinase-like isoform X2 [Macrosteles quadrilineatus]|nr:glycerol kinase-like isoform X2 [Macrosteles quadrilineatus]XP_054282298.1 glycerol kinase-like isoform X2 [Macrosteles quadrilineatus]
MSGGEAQREPLIAVIDEGTKTIRFVVFSSQTKKELVSHKLDVVQKCPQEGWAEEDPQEILSAIQQCIEHVTDVMPSMGLRVSDIAALGITNQRETTVVWDSETGEPLYNAILWSDIRTAVTVDHILAKLQDNNKNYFVPSCGLPVSPYFSAVKLRWLIDTIPAVRKAISEGRCLFGTIDTWITWNLTRNNGEALHITDVTNASRTMLMNLDTLDWDPLTCKLLNIPMEILPKICSSSEIYGKIALGPLKGIPIAGILGNQHSALVGQRCLQIGQAKNTYRSGCFLLYNTGNKKVHSTHGLLTTVSYQLGPDSPATYALEGSVAVAGTALRFLRDNLNLMKDVSESEALAKEVLSAGDVYFVPAFSGLYAPYWRKDARGIICGLTQFTTKNHIIRAALEAICFQTRDILEAMHKDCGVPLTKLQADGKLTCNRLLMQLQADICGIPVVLSSADDVTSLGVALMAGHAKGIELWDLTKEEDSPDYIGDTFLPAASTPERNLRYTKWKMAVQRSLGWAATKKSEAMTDERFRLLASIPPAMFLLASFSMLALSHLVPS